MTLRDSNPLNRMRTKRIAMVLANPGVSTTTGWPVGFWWSELSHPYLAFTDAGYHVDLFSPSGGRCEADAISDPRDPSGYSAGDLVSMGFIATPELEQSVRDTRAVDQIDESSFDAIVVTGGQSPMFTYQTAHALHAKFRDFFERGKLACALCHGVAVLCYTRLSNGEPLVANRTVTGFSNAEEDFADDAAWKMNLLPQGRHIMPWRIEDQLKALGANYVRSAPWRGFAIRDGHLITGQQNFSGTETANLVIDALGR